MTTRPRNLDLANRIVARTLEIIAYLQPERWWMENPDTGLLKRQALVRDLAYVRVDYCRFSAWGYRKRTRVWYGARRLMCAEARPSTVATGTSMDASRPLGDRLCLRWECTNLLGDGTLRHRVHLSCNGAGISLYNLALVRTRMNGKPPPFSGLPGATRAEKYRVPPRLVLASHR